MKPAPTIFVLNRGYIIVARWEQDQVDFMQINLLESAGIRRWGTTSGLGELAHKGPLPQTILDPEPEGGTIRKSQIIRTYHCNQKAWSKWSISTSEK